MRKLKGRGTVGRKLAVGSVAAATAIGLTMTMTSPGTAAEVNPAEEAEAFGQIVDTNLITENLIDVSSAYSSFPSNQDESWTDLSIAELEGLGIVVPGLDIPLFSPEGGGGLVDLGKAGALNAYAHAPAGSQAKSSAGAVGDDGAINLDDIAKGNYGSAEVDLVAALKQLGLTGVTDQLVDELRLELGALASTASAEGATYTSEYNVGHGYLTMHSPALVDFPQELQSAVDEADGTAIEDAIGAEGGLTDTLKGVSIDEAVPGVGTVKVGGEETTVSVDVADALSTVVEDSLSEELKDDNEIVSIDFTTGTIVIDLAKVVDGGNGKDLNNLDPNTELLTAETVQDIADAIAGAFDILPGLIGDATLKSLDDAKVNIVLPASVTTALTGTTNGTATVETTFAQLAGTDPTKPTVTTDLTVAGLDGGKIIDPIADTLITAVIDAAKPLISGITGQASDAVSDAATSAVTSMILVFKPVLDALNEIARVTVNEQPTLKAEESEVKGISGPGFTVNALSVTALPGTDLTGSAQKAQAAELAAEDGIDVNFASSSVRPTVASELPGPDANASASAAASANADDDSNPAAQAASQAAADADGNDTASAAANPNAEAAAESAATEDASSTASADATTEANAASNPAAQAAAESDATDDTNAEASAAADANPAAASQAAATADSSSEASVEAAATADADASADPSADAEASADPSAEAAASADPSAEAEAAAAATADADPAAEAEAAAEADSAETANSDDQAAAAANADADQANEADSDDRAAATVDVDAVADEQSTSNSGSSSTSNAGSSSSANAGSSANASAAGSSFDSNSSSNGGDLPRTGANGTFALGGLAALLIAGGAAAVFLTRRHRNMI